MPREILRFLLVIFLLLILAAIFSVQLSNSFPITISLPEAAGGKISIKSEAAAGLILVVGAWVSTASAGLGLFLLGVSLVTFQWFGPGVLNLWIIGLLGGFEIRRLWFDLTTGGRIRLRDVEQGIIVVSLFTILLFLLGTALTFLAEFDPLLLSSVYHAGGREAVSDFIFKNPPWWRGLIVLSGWVTAVMLLYQLFAAQSFYPESYQGSTPKGGQAPPVFDPLFHGLALGAIVAACCGALQIVGVSSAAGFSWNRAAEGGGSTIAATFSHPAAFGVATAILLPLLFLLVRGLGRPMAVLGGFSLLLISLWSGSRTIWIGLLVFWMWFISGLVVLDRSRPPWRYLAMIVFVIVAAVGFGYPPLNGKLQQIPGTPPGIVRMLELINWEQGGEEITRRSAHSRELYQIWRGHPLIGVGVGRLGQIGTIDRSNDFYLQILAETGILGAILLVVAFVLYARMLRGDPAVPGSSAVAGSSGTHRAVTDREVSDGAVIDGPDLFPTAAECLFHSRGTLLLLLVLLLTGPHLLNDEIRYLAVMILALAGSSASSAEARGLFQARWLLFTMTLVFPVAYAAGIILTTRLHVEKGLYRSESEGGRIIAWTGSEARLGICRLDGPINLHFRSSDPQVAQSPVTVRIDLAGATEGLVLGEVLLVDNEWHELMLDNIELESQPLPIVLSVSVNRLWQRPADRRWLGVAVEWTSGMCPWAR